MNSLALVLALIPVAPFADVATPGAPVFNGSFYRLKTTTLGGKPADLSDFRGKVTLAVNVASASCAAPSRPPSGARPLDNLQV